MHDAGGPFLERFRRVTRERETEDDRSLFVLRMFLWHAKAEQCERMKLV